MEPDKTTHLELMKIDPHGPVVFDEINVPEDNEIEMGTSVEIDYINVFFCAMTLLRAILNYFNTLVNSDDETLAAVLRLFTINFNESLAHIKRAYFMDREYVRPKENPATKEQATWGMLNIIQIAHNLVSVMINMSGVIIRNGVYVEGSDEMLNAMSDFLGHFMSLTDKNKKKEEDNEYGEQE